MLFYFCFRWDLFGKSEFLYKGKSILIHLHLFQVLSEILYGFILFVRCPTIFLAIAQLKSQILVYNKFIIFLYMFQALLCSSSGGQNCIICTASGIVTICRWPPVHRRPPTDCDDTRCCIIQF